MGSKSLAKGAVQKRSLRGAEHQRRKANERRADVRQLFGGHLLELSNGGAHRYRHLDDISALESEKRG